MFTEGVLRRSGSDVSGTRRWDHKQPDEATPSKKEAPMDSAELLAYKRRLSVRDLANKFESDLATSFERNQSATTQHTASAKAKQSGPLLSSASFKANQLQSGSLQSTFTKISGSPSGNLQPTLAKASTIEERKAKGSKDAGLPLGASAKTLSYSEERKAKGNKDTGVIVSDNGGKESGLHVSDEESQFSKLNRSLNDLHGRVSGRSKNDVEEALKAAKLLSLKYARQETELTQDRAEIKKLNLMVKQSSEDATRMVEEVQAKAQGEIKAAKEEVEKVQSAFDGYKQKWDGIDLTDLEELKRAAQEAERIKMLHESSNTRAMEDEIKVLKRQLGEKSAEIARLQEQLEVFHQGTKGGPGKHQWYHLTGGEQLGTTLTVEPLDDKVSDVSLCQIQWYRVAPDGSADHMISGAGRPQYAPEPFDVGNFLRAHVTLPSGKVESLQTVGPIDPAAGLDNFVETLFKKGSAEFCVRIVVKNGEIIGKQSPHTLHVNKTRIKLKRLHSRVAKENYSASMQLCGARGGGDSSAQGLFWAPKKGVVFMLVLESERERNTVILLTRMFAKLSKFDLRGPNDVVAVS